jgi:FixJ family two-component response regulator
MPTVALVDDDPGVRRALTRVLREAAFDVVAYESAEAFLERPASTATVGCVVLDVSMAASACSAGCWKPANRCRSSS